MSKFGSTMDRIFLSHAFVVAFFESATQIISDLINIPLNHVIIRKGLGYTQFTAALLLMRPSASGKRLGALLLLITMIFAGICHFVRNDLLEMYTVPATIGLNSLYLILSLRDVPAIPLLKQRN